VARIQLTKELANSLLEFSKDQYPNEMIVLLRAKRSKEVMLIHQVVFAPFMMGGRSASTFNPYQVPIDSSIVGTAHSHPSGSNRPSLTDLLHVYGSVMMIISYPFVGPECIAVYDSRGDPVSWDIVDGEG
jgi:proteasome lid subunit RPN8/RPN11